ncbi:hypothetical protein BD01_1176 [Thermococcus nautili]|uniref:Uncharacterized protein n=1 Tax=Thermococcus nautili TaxID=195522 RepID=W8NU64_9EURY|nr:hypothetical protein BD01_1176 [Thermococcus nautili]
MRRLELVKRDNLVRVGKFLQERRGRKRQKESVLGRGQI